MNTGKLVRHFIAGLCGLLLFAQPEMAQAENAGAALPVAISGFRHTLGQVIAKLFRRGDDVPKGDSATTPVPADGTK